MELMRCLGGLWLERNISVFLHHVLDLVANSRATSTHVDAVHARKCVLFIMRSVISGLLGEKAQISAAKEICQYLVKQMNSLGEWFTLVMHCKMICIAVLCIALTMFIYSF